MPTITINRRWLGFVAIAFVTVLSVAAFLYVVWQAFPQQPKEQIVSATVMIPKPTRTAIPTPTPSPLWMFENFDNRVTYRNGFSYQWGTFVSTGGARLEAMCSAPNSPAPKTGDLYRWDKTTNILVPEADNDQYNVQRFWYPTQQ